MFGSAGLLRVILPSWTSFGPACCGPVKVGPSIALPRGSQRVPRFTGVSARPGQVKVGPATRVGRTPGGSPGSRESRL